MFCHLGKFKQAALWQSLSKQVTKKKMKLLEPAHGNMCCACDAHVLNIIPISKTLSKDVSHHGQKILKRNTFLFFCTEIFLQKILKSGFFLKTYILVLEVR